MFYFAVIKRKYHQLTNVNINCGAHRSLPTSIARSQTISINKLSRCPLVRLERPVGSGYPARQGSIPMAAWNRRHGKKAKTARLVRFGRLSRASRHSSRRAPNSLDGAPTKTADLSLSTVKHRRRGTCVRQGRRAQQSARGAPPGSRRATSTRISAGIPYGRRICVPIRHAAVGPIGAVERRTRIAIRARVRANVPPYAPTPRAVANLPAIGVSTSLPQRHRSKIRGRCHGNNRKAQSRACQETRNKFLHCNPRYGESEERTLHVGALTSMAA